LLDRPPKRKKDDGDGKTYVCGDKWPHLVNLDHLPYLQGEYQQSWMNDEGQRITSNGITFI
jgi:hypothetical protein